MLKSVRVPEPMEAPFAQAEEYIETLFGSLSRRPDEGVVRVGGERYVLMRCESLYLTWFDALASSFGEETAREFIYNTAREIGRSDSAAFAARLGATDTIDRLAAGPVHFAHCGWALVDILGDSRPAPDDSYYMHYNHPNTFESEVLRAQGRRTEQCACLFSAGYSAGWCSAAFSLEVHGREIRCLARGDDRCEFVMAPSHMLDERSAPLLG